MTTELREVSSERPLGADAAGGGDDEAVAREAPSDPPPAPTLDLDLEKPYLWRVLKHDGRADVAFVGTVWVEVGSIPWRSEWTEPPAHEIGEPYGPGEYLLIHDERARFVRIVQKALYEKVETDAS